MRELKTFQEKIEAYRKNAPTRHTQRELADAIHLDKDELSKRLNAWRYPHRNISPLTSVLVQAIVRALAGWGAIQTQEQAKDLLDLMECPHFSVSDWKTYPLHRLRSAPSSATCIQGMPSGTDAQRKVERLARLGAMLVDHSGFLCNRLESFVGREIELMEIHQDFEALLSTGGYLTITGQAGQGKSSIIAKLVDENDTEKTAHHFIPFNPGPDYQVTLLRDLMARLILKYDLSDLYVASESRAVLRDYFPKVLNEIVAKGRQEVIFIDGLDQLMEDQLGERDLSFLPNNPSPGIVFVLGTRPNDTLQPLELRKPHHKYDLPNMSRQDFDLLLEHRGVRLDLRLTDRFYQVMQKNALYLDLVAKELAQEGIMKSEAIIERVADNPENTFSLSVARLKKSPLEWREVLKPILGILLAAREPLTGKQIRHILEIDDDRIREGLIRLGGLIADDGRQHYSLFHLKLYEYLRQDENKPHKEYIFATDEEESWHKRLGDWCALGGVVTIWEDIQLDRKEQERRAYARQHYIKHLYFAREWQRLFAVLDEGGYGRAKLHYDLSTRLYAQDLDLGRKAAAWPEWTLLEGVERLTYLCKFTLLRCSLASRAYKYPVATWGLLVLLGRVVEALGLVELMTNPTRKAMALLWMAEYTEERPEQIQLLLRAQEVVEAVEEKDRKADVLQELYKALVGVGELDRAEMVIHALEEGEKRATALSELGTALARAQQWDRAKALWSEAQDIISTIVGSEHRARALMEHGRAFAAVGTGGLMRARAVWKEVEAIIPTLEEDDLKAGIMSEYGGMLAAVGSRVQALAIWIQAEAVMRKIRQSDCQAKAFIKHCKVLANAGEWERANIVLVRVETEALLQIRKRENIWGDRRNEMFYELCIALLYMHEWERAETCIKMVFDSGIRTKMSRRLITALVKAQEWQQAEIRIRSLDYNKQAEALTELAVALARIGQRERAQALSAEIDKMIRTEGHEYGREEVLCELGRVFVQIEQWERAEALICTVEDSKAKAKIVSKLSKVLAQAQQWERAEALIDTIDNDQLEKEAFCELLVALEHAGQWERVETLIHALEEDWSKANAVSLIVGDLAQRGRLNQEQERLKTFIGTLGSEEMKEMLEREIEFHLEFSGVSSPFPDSGRAALRNSIIWLVSPWNELQEALLEHRWEDAEAIISTVEVGNKKEEALTELITAFVKAHEWDRARIAIDMIEDRQTKTWSLYELGEALVEKQQWNQVERVIVTIEDSRSRARLRLLQKLSQALAAFGKHEQLLRLVQRSWLQAQTRDEAIELISMANALIKLKPEIGSAFCEAFTWVDSILKGSLQTS